MEAALFLLETDKEPLAINLLKDISARKNKESQDSKFAYIDTLTELPNRRFFDENFSRNIQRVKRYQQQLAILFVDLDKFKPVNDQYGHEVGDGLLRLAAGRLLAAVRGEDFIARIGGDEFIVMVYPLMKAKYLSVLSQRLLEVLQEPFLIDGIELSISASIGVAHSTAEEADAKELFRQADKAMYLVKKSGGNDFRIAS